jgi:quercetin dioxygenase-like cupin family protein
MPLIGKSSMQAAEPKPGWHGRFAHSPSMSFAQYEIDAGSTLHEHHHENEEVWIIVEGRLEMTEAGETLVAEAGDMVAISPDVAHSARALTKVRALVVDYPLRLEIPGSRAAR